MTKYRILEMADGSFIPQKLVLWFFWSDFYEPCAFGIDWDSVSCGTLEEARSFISADLDITIKKVHHVNY